MAIRDAQVDGWNRSTKIRFVRWMPEYLRANQGGTVFRLFNEDQVRERATERSRYRTRRSLRRGACWAIGIAVLSQRDLPGSSPSRTWAAGQVIHSIFQCIFVRHRTFSTNDIAES